MNAMYEEYSKKAVKNTDDLKKTLLTKDTIIFPND
jgi:hypothetical protein